MNSSTQSRIEKERKALVRRSLMIVVVSIVILAVLVVVAAVMAIVVLSGHGVFKG